MFGYITLSCILVLFYTDFGFCEQFNCVATEYKGSHDGKLIYKCRDNCIGTYPNCVPHCGYPCPPNSQCTSPDFCECNLGYEPNATESGRLISCKRLCDIHCPLHSSCISKDTCKCDENYEEDKSNTYSETNVAQCLPICNAMCPENSSCTAPNVCECNTNFMEVRPDGRTMQCHEVTDDKKFNIEEILIYAIVIVAVILVALSVVCVIMIFRKLKKTPKVSSVENNLDEKPWAEPNPYPN